MNYVYENQVIRVKLNLTLDIKFKAITGYSTADPIGCGALVRTRITSCNGGYIKHG